MTTDAERIHELAKELSKLKRQVAALAGNQPSEEYRDEELTFDLVSRLRADEATVNVAGLAAALQTVLDHLANKDLTDAVMIAMINAQAAMKAKIASSDEDQDDKLDKAA